MPRLGRDTVGTRDHAVKFYDRDTDMVDFVLRYVVGGLRAGDAVLVLARHRLAAAVERALPRWGVDPDLMRASCRLHTVDAAETLARFMVDGRVDQPRFEKTAAELLDILGASRTTPTGAGIRVYGELSGLLWADGNVTGAIELESRWDEMAGGLQIDASCGYGIALLDSAPLSHVQDLCDLHTDVVTPVGYRSTTRADPFPDAHLDRGQASEVFLPVGDAVGAVRRFVTDVLKVWGESQLVDDAVIVVSELAGNALTHADSPFRATLGRTADVLRLTVEDVDARRPQQLAAEPWSLSGRGMGIVDALADRWGWEELPTGKVVWAELPATIPPSRHPVR